MTRISMLISILLIIIVGCTNAPQKTEVSQGAEVSKGTKLDLDKSDSGNSLFGSPAIPGRPVPDVALTDLDGKEVNLRKLLDAQPKMPAIFMFATTTCPHCTDEFVDVQNIKDIFGNNIRVFTILVKETPSSAQEFLKENKAPGTILVDPESKAATAYKVERVPTLILTDSSSNVNYIGNYTSTEDIAQLMTKIQLGNLVREVRPGSG